MIECYDGSNWIDIATGIVAGLVTSGLVLYLDAGDTNSYPGSGTTWTDLSGKGNDGALTGGVTYSSSDGSSLYFDGSNDYVNGVHNAHLNLTGDLTVECWFRVTSSRSDWVRILGNGSSTNRTFGLYHHPNGQFLYQRFGNPNLDVPYNAPVSLNTWYHMVGTSSGNIHILYLNTSTRGASNSGTVFASSTDPYKVGYGNVHTYHIGNVSNCRVYNRAL